MRRYLYEDALLLAVRASPAAKAATLFRESQALVHAVRAELDGRDVRGDAEVGFFPWVTRGGRRPCSAHASLWSSQSASLTRSLHMPAAAGCYVLRTRGTAGCRLVCF